MYLHVIILFVRNGTKVLASAIQRWHATACLLWSAVKIGLDYQLLKQWEKMDHSRDTGIDAGYR